MCVTYLSQDRFGKALRNAAEEDLEHLVGNIYSMCKVQHEMVPKRVIVALNFAREKLYREGQEIQVVPGEKVHFDAVNPMTNQRYAVAVPLLRIGDMILSLDNYFVDGIRNLTGVDCTILQKIDGRLLRVSTSIMGKDGKRALGTFISSDSPVTHSIQPDKQVIAERGR